MKKSDITYILCSVFAAAVCLFYCWALWFPIRLPRYYPLEHTWKWFEEAGGLSQGWYGMQLFAYLAAGVATVVAYFIIKGTMAGKVELKPAVTKSLGIVSTAIIISCMGCMLYHEFSKWGIF